MPENLIPMKKTLFTITLLLCITIATTAQTQEYKQELKKMIELSGADATMKNMVPQMLSMMKQQDKTIPDNVMQFIEKEMTTYLDGMLGKMDKVYFKYLTLNDLKELNKMYQTPVWKKMLKVQPQIQQELMPDMQKMGMEISNKIMELLKEKGY